MYVYHTRLRAQKTEIQLSSMSMKTKLQDKNMQKKRNKSKQTKNHLL